MHHGKPIVWKNLLYKGYLLDFITPRKFKLYLIPWLRRKLPTEITQYGNFGKLELLQRITCDMELVENVGRYNTANNEDDHSAVELTNIDIN